jgi:hypothetical protein
MRTAVCVSGLPREVAQVWPSWKENLVDLWPDPDVFIYTGEEFPVGREFFDAVKAVDYLVEPQFKHEAFEREMIGIGYHIPHHLNDYAQQVWGLKRVWDLVLAREEKDGFKYDLVIRTRPDFIFFKPAPPSMFDLGGISTFHLASSPTISTEFACGPRDLMEKYFEIYNWVINHGKEHLPRDHPLLHKMGMATGKYNCDIILTVYFKDVLGIHPVSCDLGAGCNPYHYYRIAGRHFKGQYDGA